MKHLLTILTCTLLLSSGLKAQNDSLQAPVDVEPDYKLKEIGRQEDPVFNLAETLPVYPGGQEAMYYFIGQNMSYPKEALEANVEGMVFVQFIVEKDGSLEEVEVLKGIGHGCDQEAARVVEAMPKWQPGLQDSKPVRVRFTLPFKFQIPDEAEPEPELNRRGKPKRKKK